MFLKSLTIHNDTTLIREVLFHKGINLIVDNTDSLTKTDSGNSVGKTTVLRLIDFCLGGKGENITKDPEFKHSNLKVKQFLQDNNILITLTLIKDIDNSDSEIVEIQRNFLSYSKKVQTINGIQYGNDDFPRKLKELFFHSVVKKPTFKQLNSKNIRDEENKLMHTLRVLNPYTTDVEYELLFLFWFGVEVDVSKDTFVKDKNLEEKLQARLSKESNLPQIVQSLIIVNKEIEALEKKKKSFNINDNYESDLNRLNVIKFEVNQLSTSISRLELRRELIIESKQGLESNVANVDAEQIKKMYEKAKVLVPTLQRTFEETLTFHNGMIQQKINFITEELPTLTKNINDKKRRLNELLIEEKRLSELLSKAGAIEDLQVIIKSLNSYYEKKGKFEEQQRLWETSNKKMQFIDDKLGQIDKQLSSKDEVIQENITKFNSYFSDISSRLDGVHSLLSADNADGVYKFKIANIEGNPGTGTKKSQMTSFDLAYIKFADESGIPCLHFVLLDQIENVHSNQITNLFTKIVNEVNAQYVLPVLRDKLPKGLDISALEVLSLSQDDKLFKII